jgi:maltose alpha-D-glucosyltransferase/alpha-amylase
MEMSGSYLEAMKILGRRTAEFHLALSGERKDPDFRPEKPTAAVTELFAETIAREIKNTMALLAGSITILSPDCRRDADHVLKEGTNLLDRVHALADLGPDLGLLVRGHGDYHLGQVLSTGDDFILLDFEGEPLRPLGERRRKRPALKDVAGMLRSFDYASFTAFSKAAAGSRHNHRQLVPWRRAWYEWAGGAFLGAYLKTAAQAAFLPARDIDLILEVFMLEKVFYELHYELNNRPDWIHLPLAGILEIISKQKTYRRRK